MPNKKRVARTRNNETWTESQFWGKIRSALRRVSMYWKPAQDAKEKARRPFKGGGRQKWEYQCESCKRCFKGKDVAIDHKTPVGSLRSGDDLKGFVERMFRESPNDYQVLCNYKLKDIKKHGGIPSCHYIKSQKEKTTIKR